MLTVKSPRLSWTLVAAALALAAPAAWGQDSLATTAPPAVAPQPVPPPVPKLYTILEIRPVEEIRRDLMVSQEGRSIAESHQLRLRDSLTRQKGEIDIKKSEIEMLKARAESAKDQKLEVERKSMERERKAQELNLNVLQKRAEIEKARVELSKANLELTEASVQVYEHEQEMARKYNEWSSLSQTGTLAEAARQLVRLESDVRDLERRTLEAMRDRAARQKQVTDRELKIIESQLRLVDAQDKVVEFVNRGR